MGTVIKHCADKKWVANVATTKSRGNITGAHRNIDAAAIIAMTAKDRKAKFEKLKGNSICMCDVDCVSDRYLSQRDPYALYSVQQAIGMGYVLILVFYLFNMATRFFG